MPDKIPYHRPNRPEPKREYSSKQRFYRGAKWRGIRKRFLTQHPLCEDCGVLASEVHHRDDQHIDNSESNLCALCKSCHSKRTVSEQGGVGKAKAEMPEPPPPRQLGDDFRFG